MKVPVKVIARYVRCHPKTVRKWRKTWLETGDMKRKKGTGRKRKLSERDESMA